MHPVNHKEGGKTVHPWCESTQTQELERKSEQETGSKTDRHPTDLHG